MGQDGKNTHHSCHVLFILAFPFCIFNEVFSSFGENATYVMHTSPATTFLCKKYPWLNILVIFYTDISSVDSIYAVAADALPLGFYIESVRSIPFTRQWDFISRFIKTFDFVQFRQKVPNYTWRRFVHWSVASGNWWLSSNAPPKFKWKKCRSHDTYTYVLTFYLNN